jgi:hypothetical protein
LSFEQAANYPIQESESHELIINIRQRFIGESAADKVNVDFSFSHKVYNAEDESYNDTNLRASGDILQSLRNISLHISA